MQLNTHIPGELQIHGETVVVGHDDEVLHDVLLTIRHRLIARIEPAPAELRVGTLRFNTVLPGLVDAHVHLAFKAGAPLALSARHADLDEVASHALETLEVLLRRGVTSVRDLGSPAGFTERLRTAVQKDPYRYPHFVGFGQPVTSRSGHLSSFGLEVASPADVRDAVARCEESGTDGIKLVVTGGRLTRGTPMGCITLAPPLVQVAVDEAHRRGMPVAAHVHGTEGIVEAVRADVDTLEHCSWTDATGRVRRPAVRLLEEMKARGQMIVTAGPLPGAFVDRVNLGRQVDSKGTRRCNRQVALWRNARTARTRGVAVAIGTDSMFGAIADHGDLVARALLMTEVGGWEPLEVLQAMTGAAALASTGDPLRGIIRPGAIADVIAFDGDVLSNIDSLRNPALVVREGIVSHCVPQLARVSA